MPLLFAMGTIAMVHLATNLAAWTQVGLLADDRFMVFLAARAQSESWSEILPFAFWTPVGPDAPHAHYRPFSTILPFVLEYPWFGADAFGYHAVNSVVHCAVALLWYSCWRLLTGSAAIGLAVALLFAGFPAHGETTHWIAARTNLLSTLGIVAALRIWLGAERRGDGDVSWRRALAAAAMLFGLLCKESAVVAVPLLASASWFAADERPLRRRARTVARRSAIVWIAAAAWFVWRGFALGTFGVGAASPWQLDAASPTAWLAALGCWLAMLFAPAHEATSFTLQAPLLWLAHGALVLLALRWLRQGAPRSLLAFAVLGLVVCLLAIAGLPCDRAELTDSRYLYESSLLFCGVLGLGIAALPVRARWPAVAAMIALHAASLHGNRQSWLDAGAVQATLERDLACEPGVTRIVDVPSVHHGAFVYLTENPFYALPPFGPPRPLRALGTNDWETALRELADAAAAGDDLATTRRVAHAGGRLLPMPTTGAMFPLEPLPGVRIAFARTVPALPHAGEPLHVDVLADTNVPWRHQVRLRWREALIASPWARSAPGNGLAAVRRSIALPAAARPGGVLAVELAIATDEGERILVLESIQIGER